MERQDSHANWAEPLQDLVKNDYEAFKVKAEHVLHLTTDVGWEYVQELVDGHLRRLERQLLAGGKPLEQAEYAALCGEIAGLRKVREAAYTVLHVAEKEDAKRGDNPARLAAV